MPQRIGGLVRVEGVNAIVYCGDVENVVLFPRNGDIGGIEETGVNLIVNRQHE